MSKTETNNQMNPFMYIYDNVRHVPEEAQKEIKGGRMKGFTDINPMWRIKVLTEMFGACGTGWKIEITRQDLQPGANGEIVAFVDILLYVKNGDKWSEAIPGIGGNSFVSKSNQGLYTSDECFKMALTDAISVACKMLGVGADVYFSKDAPYGTKYDKQEPAQKQQQSKPPYQPKQQENASYPPKQQTEEQDEMPEGMATDKQKKMIFRLAKSLEALGKPKTYMKDAMQQLTGAERSEDLTKDDAKALIEWGLGIEEELKNKEGA